MEKIDAIQGSAKRIEMQNILNPEGNDSEEEE